MKSIVKYLCLLSCGLIFQANGGWLLKKTPPKIQLPKAKKLKILFAAANLTEFAEQTKAIEQLAGKKFTGPEIDLKRRLLILDYQQKQPKTSFNEINTKEIANFTKTICALIHQKPRVYKQILQFREDLKVMTTS